MVVAGLGVDALIVFGLIGVALVLFVSEVIPNDVTAIGIIVALAAVEPVSGIEVGIGSREAISGFANPATITIVAMYMLSAGIQNTGLVQRLGIYLAEFTRGSESRALAATVCTTGPIAGFINNTPVVAIFIPMITDLAEKSGVSPSKLLLPLSYAAILGGTLTLIGTSTNILASDFSRELLDGRTIGMFEFSALGLVILLIGIAYLMTVGRWLTPARIPVDADLIEEFALEDHLAKVQVRQGSPVIGRTVDSLDDAPPVDEVETGFPRTRRTSARRSAKPAFRSSTALLYWRSGGRVSWSGTTWTSERSDRAISCWRGCLPSRSATSRSQATS